MITVFYLEVEGAFYKNTTTITILENDFKLMFPEFYEQFDYFGEV